MQSGNRGEALATRGIRRRGTPFHVSAVDALVEVLAHGRERAAA